MLKTSGDVQIIEVPLSAHCFQGENGHVDCATGGQNKIKHIYRSTYKVSSVLCIFVDSKQAHVVLLQWKCQLASSSLIQ